jgi:gamma-glutamyl hercynylcysteine S-oxide synthase
VSISRALPGLVAVALITGAVASDDGPIPGNPLIEIAAGPFVFGSDTSNDNERPRRVIEGKAFAMNKTEISNAQYQRFVDATGHRAAFYSGHPVLGLNDHPVVGVSFDDAAAFCVYYGLKLPSEQEYERAARGPDGAAFPWGNAPVDARHANHGAEICCGSDDSDGYETTAPVDSFSAGASKEGILNLVGNVWEWTRDYYAPYQGEAPPDISGKYRVLRGGAWNSDPSHLTTTYRLAYDSDFRFSANGGFRCVRSQD